MSAATVNDYDVDGYAGDGNGDDGRADDDDDDFDNVKEKEFEQSGSSGPAKNSSGQLLSSSASSS